MGLTTAMKIIVATFVARMFVIFITTGLTPSEAVGWDGGIAVAAFGGIPGLATELNAFLIVVGNVAAGFAVYLVVRSFVPTLPGDG